MIKITEQGTVHLQGTPETLISDVIMIAVTAQYRLKQENPLYLAVLNKQLKSVMDFSLLAEADDDFQEISLAEELLRNISEES